MKLLSYILLQLFFVQVQYTKSYIQGDVQTVIPTDQLHNVASANSFPKWLYFYMWLTKSSIWYLKFLFIIYHYVAKKFL